MDRVIVFLLALIWILVGMYVCVALFGPRQVIMIQFSVTQ